MEIKMNMRLRSRKVNMALDDIKIPMRMAMTPPKPDRQIKHAERYFLSGGGAACKSHKRMRKQKGLVNDAD